MLADESVAAGATLWRARVEAARWASGSLAGDHDCAGPLHARVLINAAGRQASFSMPAAGRRRFRDHTVVVVQVFETATMLSGWTVVEASAKGWAYTAPLPGRRRVVMLFTDPDLLRSASCVKLAVVAATDIPASARCRGLWTSVRAQRERLVSIARGRRRLAVGGRRGFDRGPAVGPGAAPRIDGRHRGGSRLAGHARLATAHGLNVFSVGSIDASAADGETSRGYYRAERPVA